MSDSLSNRPSAPAAGQPPLLEVRNLKKFYPIYQGVMRKLVNQVRAVDDVSFSVREGETLGLVGESGCG
ncbi:MAG: peptide ABC transporter substrate-binding protein, partial [Chloroflexota bacterium]